jgi:cytoskeleton protein RodZ
MLYGALIGSIVGQVIDSLILRWPDSRTVWHRQVIGQPSRRRARVVRSQKGPSRADAMDVGAALRDARERRGLSLDQLSHATKISVTMLGAIENNRIDTLLGGIFTRGFVKAYAREVGLNAADTVRRYASQFGELADPTPGESAHTSPVAGDLLGRAESEPTGRRPEHLLLFIAAAVFLLGVAGYFTLGRRHVATLQGSTAIPTSGNITQATGSSTLVTPVAARTETAAAGPVEPTVYTAKEPSPLRLELDARGVCWISATADGKRVVYRLMQAGERQTFEAGDGLILRIGDPAAFTFSVNGTTGRPLGRAGEPVTIRLTPQNYRGFLSQ